EALDVRRPADAERLRDEAAEVDQVPVPDRLALDRLAALGLDHRPRHRAEAAPVEVAEDVDRELLPRADALHHRADRREVQEELELALGLRTVDVPRAEAVP